MDHLGADAYDFNFNRAIGAERRLNCFTRVSPIGVTAGESVSLWNVRTPNSLARMDGSFTRPSVFDTPSSCETSGTPIRVDQFSPWSTSFARSYEEESMELGSPIPKQALASSILRHTELAEDSRSAMPPSFLPLGSWSPAMMAQTSANLNTTNNSLKPVENVVRKNVKPYGTADQASTLSKMDFSPLSFHGLENQSGISVTPESDNWRVGMKSNSRQRDDCDKLQPIQCSQNPSVPSSSYAGSRSNQLPRPFTERLNPTDNQSLRPGINGNVIRRHFSQSSAGSFRSANSEVGFDIGSSSSNKNLISQLITKLQIIKDLYMRVTDALGYRDKIKLLTPEQNQRSQMDMTSFCDLNEALFKDVQSLLEALRIFKKVKMTSGMSQTWEKMRSGNHQEVQLQRSSRKALTTKEQAAKVCLRDIKESVEKWDAMTNLISDCVSRNATAEVLASLLERLDPYLTIVMQGLQKVNEFLKSNSEFQPNFPRQPEEVQDDLPEQRFPAGRKQKLPLGLSGEGKKQRDSRSSQRQKR